jgi:hypothetical protein
MLTRIGSFYALTGLAMASLSCVPPKATVVAESPVKKIEKAPEPAAVPEPLIPELPGDDGLRMPDILAMPEDSDFRATNPVVPKSGPDSGAVISRPPTDPPSRVKPKETE